MIPRDSPPISRYDLAPRESAGFPSLPAMPYHFAL
jgi:hypothetical protein